ncbi:MAG TPA: hypothetical protein VFR02_03240 [bacterium]|nr:hypothetical protein [bacterium]
MKAFRKISFCLALAGFSAFLTLSLAENFHHHGALESHDHCAMCAWTQADAKAVPVTLPHLLAALVLVFVAPRVFHRAPAPRLIPLPGRSPPTLP